MSKKLKWAKPKLIVLVRSNSKEMILGECKNDSSSGPETMVGSCSVFGSGCPTCTDNSHS